MLRLADKLPLTGLPRINPLRGTLVLPEEIPDRPSCLAELAPCSLPDRKIGACLGDLSKIGWG
jgi:hypothetical protein